MTQKVVRIQGLDALLHVPAGEVPPGGFPAIVFLHGAGERGRDPRRVAAHGVPKLVARDSGFPFVTLSPQCPAATWWVRLTDALAAAVTELVDLYPVDPDRVILTGLSMGGYGTWKLAARCPERFAAAVPICGGGKPEWAPRLVGLPIRAYHGTDDDVVPVQATLEMVEALRALGAPVELVLYEGVGHDSWTRTYDDPDLLRWWMDVRRPRP